ncbi:MAG: PP0621 family protein [Sideroxydans sp.]|nr:PP0621 family protein [Sideroxydans sp.]
MSRLIFILAIVAVIYVLLRRYRKNSLDQANTPPVEPQTMLRCKQCGVHVPSSEAVLANGENFCCAAHRDAYRA